MYDAEADPGRRRQRCGRNCYTENMFNVTDAAAAIRDYADNGYNLIIAPRRAVRHLPVLKSLLTSPTPACLGYYYQHGC